MPHRIPGGIALWILMLGLVLALSTAASAQLAACEDGIDNDGDGLVDHASVNAVNPDVGCAAATDPTEIDETGNYECDDGIDNEAFAPTPGESFYCPFGCSPGDLCTRTGCQPLPVDGLVDLADPGCGSDPASVRGEFPQCQDGLENDTDGRVDFDCGSSARGGLCATVCDGGSEDRMPCDDALDCPGGACVDAPASPYCVGPQPASDPREDRGCGYIWNPWPGGGGSGGCCGLGFEIALVLPPLAWLRRRRRSA